MEKPTELLMRCMEDFGESEATVAIVLYKQQDCSLSWRATRECSRSEIIGMLACAQASLLSDFVANRDSGDEKAPGA